MLRVIDERESSALTKAALAQIDVGDLCRFYVGENLDPVCGIYQGRGKGRLRLVELGSTPTGEHNRNTIAHFAPAARLTESWYKLTEIRLLSVER